MIEPVVNENGLTKFCKHIVEICETFVVKQIAYPILIVFPPVVIMSIVQKAELKEQAAAMIGGDIGNSLNSISSLLVIILAPLYMVLVKALYAGVKILSKPSRELSKDDYLSILKAIEIAVNEKAKRMSKSARNAITSKISAEDTFKAITQPDQQISLLINGVHSIFEFLSRDKVEYRVGLLKIDSNKPVEWLAFHPQSTVPGTTAKALSDPSSTVACCIKAKKIVIVQDIAKELRAQKKCRYLASTEEGKDKGSQLCYPIVHPATGKIQHVITIAGDKAGV